jgi:hypothetical protein
MATADQLKSYLACWFQLGKPIIGRVHGGGEQKLLPQSVVTGERYSSAFETCWQQIQTHAGYYYLEGTDEPIADLLHPQWEIAPCSRCQMPTPLPASGLPPQHCPCHNMSNWPNTELPLPRVPVSNSMRLRSICHRLQNQ